MKLKYLLLLGCSLALLQVTNAQLSIPGTPYSLDNELLTTGVPVVEMPEIDLDAVQAEDAIFDNEPSVPYRFGIEHEVDLNMDNSGTWLELPNGGRLWRLAIRAPEALSINLVYDDFFLPAGSKFFLHNGDYEQILGAFTNRNNKADGGFGTALTYGEISYLEYYEPRQAIGKGRISISSVIHGYRSVFDKDNADLGSSGSCNVETACPQGNNWRDEIRAVGKSIIGPFSCSGTLVGNATGDLRPYFLTANHCGFSSNMVIYWLFERPTCGNTTPDDTKTTTGATVLASVDGSPGGSIRGSDHLLVELDENPSDSYDVYYAGWDANGATPQAVTGIHHPAGDAKKISMENDPLTSTDYLSNTPNPNEAQWRVADWDSGTTEGGSSGSPIFDNTTKRIVGMLSGGFAACGNNSADWYGKFSFGWNNNGTTNPAFRLRDWLDPNNTGTLAINGYGITDFQLSTADNSERSCGANSVTYTIDVTTSSGSTDPVTLSLSGQPSGSSVSFSSNPVVPGNSVTLTIGNLNAATPGNYFMTVQGTNASGSVDLSLTLEVINDCSGVTPCLQFDTGPFNNFEPPVCFPNCQTPTTVGFEVFANESYVIRDLTPGAEYTFEFCSGYDPATWAANITVAVWDDANGTATANVETVSGCSVTFTAPAGGDVVVIIFDTCGNPTLEVDNGTPTFRCTGNGSTLPTACVGAGDCSDPILLACGDNVSGNTADGQNNFDTQGNFTNYGGPELVYEFQAEPGALDIQLTNLSADVDLFLTAPCNNSDPAQIAASRNAGTTSESITGTLNNGGTFYIIIDGFGGAVSTFDLSVTCTSPPNNCPNNLPVNDNPIATGTYKAANTITSVGRVASGTTVTFEAGQSITLSPGFIAENGSTFTARIQPCTSTRPSDIEDRNEVLEVFTVAAGTAVAENEVKVYPNPFSTQTMVEVQLSVESDLQIELYSLAGKRISVVTSNRDVAAGMYQFPVDATRLESGMYLLMIRIDEEIQTQKLSLIK